MKADRKERFVELGTELVGIIADVLFEKKENNVTPINEAKKVETKKAETKKADEAPKKEVKKAETKPSGKAYSINNPAPADELKIFKAQWKALGPKQNDYLEGKIDSLGNPIADFAEESTVDEPIADEPAAEEYENFDEPANEEITVEQVREAFKNLAQAKTSAECTAILKLFKVTKISEIKKEDYAKVVAKAQAAANA